MIKETILRFICFFKGHQLHHAGSCPFTGSTYEYCIRCTAMIPIQEAK